MHLPLRSGEANVTNIFHFTFTAPSTAKPLPQVLPKTYEGGSSATDMRARMH